MSKPIQVGDLVRVIRAHDCKPTRGYGVIFTVERIAPARRFECIHCLGTIKDGRPLAYGIISRGPGWHPLEWLRRIPPLDELEGERTEEDLREPA